MTTQKLYRDEDGEIRAVHTVYPDGNQWLTIIDENDEAHTFNPANNQAVERVFEEFHIRERR